ncbi:DUF1861 family protein [Cohnella fermenti]|nr:DUF1861 family protein [Cohnella fermenti]
MCNKRGKDDWGGYNQAYYLDSGKVGIIGHICYKTIERTVI